MIVRKVYSGVIKLTIGGMTINHAGYTSRMQRDIIIEMWRTLYAYKMEGMSLQIYPHLRWQNENEWSTKV